jgi:hypothetical protein
LDLLFFTFFSNLKFFAVFVCISAIFSNELKGAQMTKNLILITATFLSGVTYAQQNDEQQKAIETTYKVICGSDAELVADAELMQLIGSNQQAVQARQAFQAFIASPKAAVEKAIAEADAAVAQAKTEVEQAIATEPKAAESVKQLAEQYAKENNVSMEEAQAVAIAYFVDYVLMQKTGVDSKNIKNSSVYSAVASSCNLMNYAQTEITKSGCKKTSGEVVDMTEASQLCQSVSKDLQDILQSSSQIQQIQQQAQALIQATTQAINGDANAKIAPIAEAMNTPIQSVVDKALELIAKPTTPAAEVTQP